MKKKFKGDYVKKNSHRYNLLKKLEHGPKRYKDLVVQPTRKSKKVDGKLLWKGYALTHSDWYYDTRANDLRRAGLIKRPKKGVYQITEKGKKVLKNAKPEQGWHQW
jgi:hypothetical protein